MFRSLKEGLIGGAAQGYLQGVSLATVVQLVGLERMTCSVSVHAGGRSGRLDFVQGELVDARAGDLAGTEAAYEILGWPDPSIDIASAVASRARSIERPLAAILLDVSRLADERLPPWPPSLGEPGEPGGPSADQGAAPAAAAQGEPMSRMQEILDALREEVPEFVSTDVVNVESGLSIGGGSADPQFDSSLASATSAEVVKANRSALELLGLGADSTEDILISTDKVYLLIRMLGADYYLVLAVRRKGNLGLARAIMKKHQPRLMAAVGELV
jgi:predicted regulator of Ras-like GTPase activity (Roadblock/LC7/MglB family)